ncbi:MAG: M1 family metallopeptidase [Solirubrobacteraceae bacterium]|nr:M1 family metallopeptidase [Solirubrobacteraceae bacterium]
MLRRLVVSAAVTVAAAPLAAASATAAPKPTPKPVVGSPGAPALGDSLFPTLGNGGYDALHYNFTLTFGKTPSSPVTGTETLTAKATQALSSFSLDLGPAPLIGAVTVNGKSAATTRTAEKLIITPSQVLPAGSEFTVKISGLSFTATPLSDDPSSVAYIAAPSGSFTAPQPAYMHHVLPVNDHPLDKATYYFKLTTPAGTMAVASGKLSSKERLKNGSTVYAYAQRQPMASELIQLASGAYKMVDQGVGSGVRLRNIIAKGAGSVADDLLADNAKQMAWVVKHLGAYPFDVYGVIVTDEDPQFALETQTLTMIPGAWFENPDDAAWVAPTMVHELVHQWYGDSVSPKDWADIWVSEGHATWYEARYADDEGYFEDYSGFPTFNDFAQRIYELGDKYRANYGPVGRPLSGSDDDLFSPQSYYGGFLVLYALRQEIGARAFAKLEREYVTRYKGQTKGTADFVALASKIAGRDLSAFLNAWIYGLTTPPMPGHPDWAVEPVDVTLAATSRASATTLVSDPLPLPRR